MRCPGCGKHMVVLEVENVEIDHCLACGGVWLDRGELEILLEGASNRDELMGVLGAVVEEKEKSLRCPICSKKLDKVRYGKERELVLDKCPRDDGLWFDRNELAQALRMGRFENERVYGVLREVFGGEGRKGETR